MTSRILSITERITSIAAPPNSLLIKPWIISRMPSMTASFDRPLTYPEAPYTTSRLRHRTGRMVVHVSETYTAVYAREGDEWVAEIAETGLSTRGANVAEVRNQIREALATQLATTPAAVAVVDQFTLPGALRAVQSEVRATRTVEEKAKMAASMTESKTAKQWAAELELAQRAPAAVKWLSGLEGELDVDEMC